jgi:hypothetical protein
MSLKIEIGDMLTETLGKKVLLVQGCNAQGVQASGIAKLIRDLYPHAYLTYKQTERRHGLKLGAVNIWHNQDGPSVANAITQEFYGREKGKQYADYDAVIVSLQAVAQFAKEQSLPVHLPMIAGGLGGLDTKRLTAIFQAVFHDVDATLWLLE